MKIAYVAHVSSRSNGVLAKVRAQAAIWRGIGHDVRIFYVSNAPVPCEKTYLVWRNFERLNARGGMLSDIEAFSPDMVYLRPGKITLNTQIMLHKFGRKMVVEINSNYIEEGRHNAHKSFLKYAAYRFNVSYFPYVARSVAGIVCVTHELEALSAFSSQPNKMVVPNGILLKADMLCKQNAPEGPVRILFLGSPDQPWHGVDTLPNLAQRLGDGFHIHVIGPRTMQLGQERLPQNITVHGYMDRAEYSRLIASMHIGLGSAALYRNKMNEACPLKVREYIASGFPVILPYRDSAFSKECPEWVLRTPNEPNAFRDMSVVSRIGDFCVRYRDFVVQHHASASYVDAAVLEADKVEHLRRWVDR